MAHPIYVLAGQSNARAMRDTLLSVLEAKHGVGGFDLVHVSAPGAPLTYKRADEDWAVESELKQTLRDETVKAARDHPQGEIAGLIWIQGEADTYAIAPAETYGAALELLIADWRTDLRDAAVPLGAEAKVAVARLSDHASGGNTRQNWAELGNQQDGVAARDALIETVNPDSVANAAGFQPDAMFSDGLHYDVAFQAAFAQALIDALAPPAQRPPGTIGTDKDDFIEGTAGADLLRGGAGNDTYVFNHAGDRIDEGTGAGQDTVMSLRDVSLRSLDRDLENIELAGIAPLQAMGNAQANVITGNAGDNRLNGGAGRDDVQGGQGDDLLIDKRGGDRLSGGTGDDIYRLFAPGSRLDELADEGYDRVISEVSLTLRFHSQHIEDLKLVGNGAVDGTGNGLDNILTGNHAANALDGAWGDDLLIGRAGGDRLTGHRGDDVMTGGKGRDVFVFASHHGPGTDRITDFDPNRDQIHLNKDIAPDAFIHRIEANGLRLSWAADKSVLLEGITTFQENAEWLVFL